MRELVAQLLSNGISRRDFVRRVVASGVCSLAALLFLMFGVAQAQSQEWAQWGGPHRTRN